jgi:hypothetical protein
MWKFPYHIQVNEPYFSVVRDRGIYWCRSDFLSLCLKWAIKADLALHHLITFQYIRVAYFLQLIIYSTNFDEIILINSCNVQLNSQNIHFLQLNSWNTRTQVQENKCSTLTN